jgi:hypothetical protein
MKGSNQRNQTGVYGTQRESAPNNTPGARTGALSWTDSKGDLWLLGGTGYATQNQTGYLNDLWKLETTQTSSIVSQSATDRITITPSIEDDREVKAASISIYPNPANLTVNLRLQGDWTKGNLAIHLVDRLGRVTKEWKQHYAGGQYGVVFNTSGIPNGLYFLVIIDSDGKRITGKLMIQH